MFHTANKKVHLNLLSLVRQICYEFLLKRQIFFSIWANCCARC